MRKINKKKFKTLLKDLKINKKFKFIKCLKIDEVILNSSIILCGTFFEFFTLYIEHLKNDYHIITINYFNDKIYTCIYNCDIEELYNKFINELFLKFEVYA
jgi:hypothetical protein